MCIILLFNLPFVLNIFADFNANHEEIRYFNLKLTGCTVVPMYTVQQIKHTHNKLRNLWGIHLKYESANIKSVWKSSPWPLNVNSDTLTVLNTHLKPFQFFSFWSEVQELHDISNSLNMYSLVHIHSSFIHLLNSVLPLVVNEPPSLTYFIQS